MRLGRLSWAGTAAVLLALVALPAAGAAAAEPSPVEVQRVTVDVDRDVGTEFGGRVDVTVRFRVVNTGTETVQPTARIELQSQIGGGARSAPIELDPLGPGEHVDVTRTVGSLLPFGSAHATVTVRVGDGVTTASASEPVPTEVISRSSWPRSSAIDICSATLSSTISRRFFCADA